MLVVVLVGVAGVGGDVGDWDIDCELSKSHQGDSLRARVGRV